MFSFGVTLRPNRYLCSIFTLFKTSFGPFQHLREMVPSLLNGPLYLATAGQRLHAGTIFHKSQSDSSDFRDIMHKSREPRSKFKTNNRLKNLQTMVASGLESLDANEGERSKEEDRKKQRVIAFQATHLVDTHVPSTLGGTSAVIFALSCRWRH